MFKMILRVILLSSLLLKICIAAPSTNELTKRANDAETNHIPMYSFSYGVNDPFTGDSKDHTENRVGDVVNGRYSLADADGTRRVVDYHADAATGYTATVRKVPTIVKNEEKSILEDSVPAVLSFPHSFLSVPVNIPTRWVVQIYRSLAPQMYRVSY